MKKPLLGLLVCLCAAAAGQAQENAARESAANNLFRISHAPTETALAVTVALVAPRAAASSFAPLAAASSFAPLAAATSTPEPAPRFIYGTEEDYRWQLGFSYAGISFHSTPFDAQLNGINTSVVYAVKPWLGLEGTVTSAFSSEMLPVNAHVKFAFYGGGPRIGWHNRVWKLWSHVILGGAHLQPQTSLGGRDAMGYAVGVGVYYRHRPWLSIGVQGDWLNTRFFNQSQSNFQIVIGPVFHF